MYKLLCRHIYYTAKIQFTKFLLVRLVERAQLTLTDKELKLKSKQYDSIIDDVINSNNSPASSALPAKQPTATTTVTAETAPAVNKTATSTTLDAASEHIQTSSKFLCSLPCNFLAGTCLVFFLNGAKKYGNYSVDTIGMAGIFNSIARIF